MSDILRIGGGSWIGRIIHRYKEPAALVEMPAEAIPPEPRKRQAHPDCPRCAAGTCSTDHLMAGLGFGQTGWDGTWSTDTGATPGVRDVYPR